MLASLETFDGASKKPFKATGLLNKSQLKLASYIKANKDVTLQGTKRFTDKSGEYYLKNVQLQNRKQDPNSTVKNTLNNPQNLENCLNRDINFFNNIRRRASKIVTLLPEYSLTPIPKKEGINKQGIANKFGKKELDDAQRTAVFIRRLEYATSMKKQMNDHKNLKKKDKKIELIQEWWKTMFKIIKLQKNMRGFLFRKKLMNNLEHQEKLLQFITEFDNIHNYHLYRQFMDNLKKKRDYEKAKLMEKCEDFGEKLDNLEKMRDWRNLRDYFDRWKNNADRKRKDALDNLAKKINDVFNRRKNKNNKYALRKIKDASKTKIFTIKKEIKRGRRKSCIINFKKAKHSKFDKDNIIRKIKTRFINNAKEYINNIYDKFYSSKNNKNKPLLKKINPKFPKALSKQENRKFLEMNTKQMFSENLMERFKHSCKDYNKKNIEELYQKKEAKEVIQIMDKKVSDLYKDYISSTIPEFSLKQDLVEIANKGESKYADKYEEIAINLIEILSSSRKKRKKTFNVFN